ncbi:MAG: PhnD/SsuA/transferrin family substrate-binding protein [Actinobacteria bacterium]|nr:PhnD/SsuA/transferrin family substrate-binding protein [Actinomycetota bacterium]
MRLDPPPVELLVAPVLEGGRYDDRPIYFSDVIVRKDNLALNFTDLRGSSWSFNESGSHSGYNVVLYHLVEMGESPRFFGRIIQAGSHQRSIRLVARGEVDASAIDSQVLAVELREHPRMRASLRVIDSLGPSPIQPVVVASRLPGRVKDELRTALAEMHNDAEGRRALAWGFVKRLEAVVDADYDPIRRMLEAVERAGVGFGDG